MLLDSEEGELRYVASTDEAARDLERLQGEVGEGPCVDAFIHSAVVGTNDLTADDRWPRLTDRLPRKDGIRAVLGLPTRIAGTTVGTLDAYCTRRHAWDDSDIGALRAYNDVLEGRRGAQRLADRESTPREHQRLAPE